MVFTLWKMKKDFHGTFMGLFLVYWIWKNQKCLPITFVGFQANGQISRDCREVMPGFLYKVPQAIFVKSQLWHVYHFRVLHCHRILKIPPKKKSETMNLIKFSDIDLHWWHCFTLMPFWQMTYRTRW